MGFENNFITAGCSNPSTITYISYDLANKRKPHFYFGGAFDLEAQIACINRVVYSDPATIVFWNDGTKTIAKCHPEDTYIKESGLAICILKKIVGGASLHKTFEDWIPEDNKTMVTLADVRKKHK